MCACVIVGERETMRKDNRQTEVSVCVCVCVCVCLCVFVCVRVCVCMWHLLKDSGILTVMKDTEKERMDCREKKKMHTIDD